MWRDAGSLLESMELFTHYFSEDPDAVSANLILPLIKKY